VIEIARRSTGGECTGGVHTFTVHSTRDKLFDYCSIFFPKSLKKKKPGDEAGLFQYSAAVASRLKKSALR